MKFLRSTSHSVSKSCTTFIFSPLSESVFFFSQELLVCFFWEMFKLTQSQMQFFSRYGKKTAFLLTNSIFFKKWAKINLPGKKTIPLFRSTGWILISVCNSYVDQCPPQGVCIDINCEFISSIMNCSQKFPFSPPYPPQGRCW